MKPPDGSEVPFAGFGADNEAGVVATAGFGDSAVGEAADGEAAVMRVVATADVALGATDAFMEAEALPVPEPLGWY